MALQLVHLSAWGEVPEDGQAILAGSQHRVGFRTEQSCWHVVSMHFQSVELLSALHTPYHACLVTGRGQDVLRTVADLACVEGGFGDFQGVE